MCYRFKNVYYIKLRYFREILFIYIFKVWQVNEIIRLTKIKFIYFRRVKN